MASKKRDLIGLKFGKLTVIDSCGCDKYKHYMSKVRCECGKEYIVPDTELIYGRRDGCRSCNMKKHGMTNTPLFERWSSMKQRCYDKNHNNYKHYGGRGIVMCDEWENDFQSFYDWSVENGYKENLTIDRIDNNGNYEPSNCRWVDMKTQSNNRRTNRKIEVSGEMYSISDLGSMYCIKPGTLRFRLESGWDVSKALSIPAKIGRNQYEKI